MWLSPLGQPPAVVWGAELAEGQVAGLGTYRLLTLGKSVKGVAATSQAAVLEGTSQVFTKARHIWQATVGLGENRPVGPPDVWKWSEVHPKRCAWEDSDRS